MHHREIHRVHNRHTATLILAWILLFMATIHHGMEVYAHSQKVPETIVHVKIIDISTITYEKDLTMKGWCGLLADLMNRVGRPTDPNKTFHECPELQKRLDSGKHF